VVLLFPASEIHKPERVPVYSLSLVRHNGDMFRNSPLAIALNSALEATADNGQLCVAFNFAMPDDGSVPEWVQLIPPGRDVVGIDGRSWLNDQPQGVVDYFTALQSKGRDLVFDFEHSTELKAPKGENAPAAAWGKAMEIRGDGEIWAKPDWNAIGQNAVGNKEYRYISPVLIFEKSTRRIVGIKSVGLTNNPNLFVTALNQAQGKQSNQEDKPMEEFLKALCQALGIDTSGGKDQVIAEISTLKRDKDTALNQAQNPSLDKFVPRSDHELALNRATTAESALAEIKKTALNGEIETAINQALKDRKITPASVEYHTARCQQEGGLDEFNKYVEAQPVITAESGLDKKDPNDETGTAMNAAEQALADQFGNSAEDLAKYG